MPDTLGFIWMVALGSPFCRPLEEIDIMCSVLNTFEVAKVNSNVRASEHFNASKSLDAVCEIVS